MSGLLREVCKIYTPLPDAPRGQTTYQPRTSESSGKGKGALGLLVGNTQSVPRIRKFYPSKALTTCQIGFSLAVNK